MSGLVLVAIPELVLGKIRVGDVVDSASDMVGLDLQPHRTARQISMLADAAGKMEGFGAPTAVRKANINQQTGCYLGNSLPAG